MVCPQPEAATSTASCPRTERRWAPDDTGYYTEEEFVEFYGGTAEWDAADAEQQAPAVEGSTSRRHRALEQAMRAEGAKCLREHARQVHTGQRTIHLLQSWLIVSVQRMLRLGSFQSGSGILDPGCLLVPEGEVQALAK